jgi:hypothetical protein
VLFSRREFPENTFARAAAWRPLPAAPWQEHPQRRDLRVRGLDRPAEELGPTSFGGE